MTPPQRGPSSDRWGCFECLGQKKQGLRSFLKAHSQLSICAAASGNPQTKGGKNACFDPQMSRHVRSSNLKLGTTYPSFSSHRPRPLQPSHSPKFFHLTNFFLQQHLNLQPLLLFVLNITNAPPPPIRIATNYSHVFPWRYNPLCNGLFPRNPCSRPCLRVREVLNANHPPPLTIVRFLLPQPTCLPSYTARSR